MPYSVTYEAEAGYIAIGLIGTIDQPMARQLAAEVTRLMQKHNCFLVLNDAREATTTISIADIYDLPVIIAKMLDQLGLPVERLRRAIVVSAALNDFTFLEAVSRIRGQNIMLFRDMAEARKWLVGK
jgi:hypothetical protein